MTKKQYESLDSYDFLTDEDKDRMRELNAKNEYGLTNGQVIVLARKHRKLRKEEDYYAMALIEFRLTHINFHSDCGLLQKGEYEEVIERWTDR
jgi:hypothetical protein